MFQLPVLLGLVCLLLVDICISVLVDIVYLFTTIRIKSQRNSSDASRCCLSLPNITFSCPFFYLPFRMMHKYQVQRMLQLFSKVNTSGLLMVQVHVQYFFCFIGTSFDKICFLSQNTVPELKTCRSINPKKYCIIVFNSAFTKHFS